ncbi:Receptor-type tyrosine-protein phosphatase C [Dissostichus eleginoides]|uniref:Receptor-type tyrosine-protein phosphatase C n=1 Tax=Dissostichus eleginoides TaxID=100907 RepID=A0AAD9C987_DISEL|nr:Receptor-type tyrosine-protein phosphatase C [Dissostichus eleginoides]
MAGLKILLLWAGILVMAKDVSTTLPPRTSTNSPSAFSLQISTSTPRTMTETTVISPYNQTSAHKPPLTTPTLTSNPPMPATYSTSIPATTAPTTITPPSPTPITALDLPTNTSQAQPQPPITTSNTSVTPNTTAETQAPPPLECSYMVAPSKSGFDINMKRNFTPGNYIINIKETGRPDTGNNYSVQFSDESLTHEIKHLKPCTEYEHDVAFIDAVGKETPCSSIPQTNTTKQTNGVSKDDIEDGSCMPGHVCYRSDWDISSSLSTSNNISAEPCKSEQKKEICFKPHYNDICTNLTTTFTSGNCANAFSLTRSITADFLNPSEINQTNPTKLPAEIKTDLPPNCKNLHITYSCQEDGKPNELKNLTDLEPDTDYSCTGQIMDNNLTITNTTAIKFRIDCDLKMSIKEPSVTNTSIDLSWTTDIHPKYNNNREPALNNLKWTRTKIGVPGEIKNLEVDRPEHNLIKATCERPTDFNGPEKYYIARLYGGVLNKSLTQTKCEFEFKDLSYSTKYELQVTASNGDYESIPTEHLSPLPVCDDNKALIVRLVFFIMASVAFAVLLYKIYTLRLRKSRKQSDADVDENAVIELVEIYANVSQSECRRRDST